MSLLVPSDTPLQTDLSDLDWSSPVDWSHPDNAGLAFWGLTPQAASGGTHLNDVTGFTKGAILTPTNAPPTWVSGPGGQAALLFNGSNQNAIAFTTPAVQISGTGSVITLSCWFMITTKLGSGGRSYLIRKGHEVSNGNEWSLGFYGVSSTDMRLCFRSISVSGGRSQHGGTSLAVGVWYHAIASCIYGAQFATIWLNGAGESATLDDSSNSLYFFPTTTDSLVFGSSSNNTEYFSGAIAGPRVQRFNALAAGAGFAARTVDWSLNPNRDHRFHRVTSRTFIQWDVGSRVAGPAPDDLPFTGLADLDWSNPVNKEHPDNQGLVFQVLASPAVASGLTWNDLTRNTSGARLSSAFWATGPAGTGIDTRTLTNYADFTLPQVLQLQPPLTLVWDAYLVNLSTTASECFGMTPNNNSAPFTRICIERLAANTVDLTAVVGGSFSRLAGVLTPSSGPISVVAVITATSQRVYVVSPTGIAVTTASSSIPSIAYSSTDLFNCGTARTSGRASNTITMGGRVLNRAVDATWAQRHYQQTWGTGNGVLSDADTRLNRVSGRIVADYPAPSTAPAIPAIAASPAELDHTGLADLDWSSPVNWEHPDNAGLAFWGLTPPGAAAGTHLCDLTGLTAGGALTPTNAPPTWVSGPGGQAGLLFNGSTQYVTLNNSVSSIASVSSAGWYLAGWVMHTTAVNPANNQNYIRKDDGSPRAIYLLGYGFGTGGICVATFNGSLQIVGGPSPVVGTRYRVLGGYSRKLNQLQLYVNGVLVGTATGTTSDLNTIPGDLLLGAARNNPNPINEFFSGALTGVRLQGSPPDAGLAARDYDWSLNPNRDPRYRRVSRMPGLLPPLSPPPTGRLLLRRRRMNP